MLMFGGYTCSNRVPLLLMLGVTARCSVQRVSCRLGRLTECSGRRYRQLAKGVLGVEVVQRLSGVG